MDESVRFYQASGPYGCLSNGSPHQVVLDGTTWPTVEHYVQAQKFHDAQHRWQIQLARSPALAMQLGRDSSKPLRPGWEQIKDDVMRKALRAKVIQHADVRTVLLASGEADIIAHSADDRYWADGGDGSGANRLGQLWMELRAELNKDGPYDELGSPLPPPWLKHPDIPRYSIGWRMGAGEAYLLEWGPWYSGLTAGGKRAYQARYPAPRGWRGYYREPDE